MPYDEADAGKQPQHMVRVVASAGHHGTKGSAANRPSPLHWFPSWSSAIPTLAVSFVVEGNVYLHSAWSQAVGAPW
jgi:hypothetical protein